jgi:hypothetical protein
MTEIIEVNELKKIALPSWVCPNRHTYTLSARDRIANWGSCPECGQRHLYCPHLKPGLCDCDLCCGIHSAATLTCRLFDVGQIVYGIIDGLYVGGRGKAAIIWQFAITAWLGKEGVYLGRVPRQVGDKSEDDYTGCGFIPMWKLNFKLRPGDMWSSIQEVRAWKRLQPKLPKKKKSK